MILYTKTFVYSTHLKYKILRVQSIFMALLAIFLPQL
jgi:hypothetical protein